VFLDEPTTGLDVQARRSLWDGIRAFHDDGGTVVLTSHYLEEIEAPARRVVVIGGGRVLADDTVDAVRGLVAIRRVSLTFSSTASASPTTAPNPGTRTSARCRPAPSRGSPGALSPGWR
jgi:ABC-2 type transport system ATP-binding protein